MAGVKVNLGCGLQAPASWVNIDRSPSLVLDRIPGIKVVLRRLGVLEAGHMASWPRNVVLRDVRRRLPFDDASVSAVYSSHMLEHLYLHEARAVLDECHRVLAPSGILRLALPDGYQIARELVDGGDGPEAALRYNDMLNAHGNRRPRRIVGALASGPHRWQPTAGLVTAMLHDAGFPTVERRPFRVGALPGLGEVEHREEGFFLEASP